MDYAAQSLIEHAKWRGKIEVNATVPVTNRDELSLAYTPGVARPCLAIKDDPSKSYELTRRWNMCAVITDGSAVLGLGDIGPEAGMPVMEGKCVLFKSFGGVDAFPLCIGSKDVDDIVRTVKLISGSFGGINLEDISAPRCFEIERRLREICDIPVFHDDQHGTAVIALAGLKNAMKVVGKDLSSAKIVINGVGAAGAAVCRLLMTAGCGNITLVDRQGIMTADNSAGMGPDRRELAGITNPGGVTGTLADALAGADVFMGFSAPGLVTQDMVRTMNRDAVIFACANPDPEIFPEEARAAGAAIVASGRSDYPNQINNVLAFPGIFRGAFDVRASEINDEMKLAAVDALASIIPENELGPENIIPQPFDKRCVPAIAAAVAEAARRTGAARI